MHQLVVSFSHAVLWFSGAAQINKMINSFSGYRHGSDYSDWLTSARLAVSAFGGTPIPAIVTRCLFELLQGLLEVGIF